MVTIRRERKGESGITVSVSPDNVVMKKDSSNRQRYSFDVRVYNGTEALPYYTGEKGEGDNFVCGYLNGSMDALVKDTLAWTFRQGEDNKSFTYILALQAGKEASLDISFDVTVTIDGKKTVLTQKVHATTVEDGAQGIQGIPGCMVRKSEWQTGVMYRNDEALTSGTRYIDVVTVTDSLGNASYYQCRTTHISTTQNKPSGNATSEVWVPVSNYEFPIRTPLVIADTAVMKFGQANRLIVMDTEGKTVQGCLQGVDSKDKYVMWFGGETAEKANFRVSYDGNVKGNNCKFYNGYFEGTIYGVSGSFQKLYGSYTSSDGKIYENKNAYMYFDPTSTLIGINGDFRVDGGVSIYGGDILHNGTDKDGHNVSFKANQLYVRGSFGARSRTVGVVSQNTLSVYVEEGSRLVGTTTLTPVSQGYSVYFNVPCFTRGEDGFDEVAVPIDTFIMLEPSMGDCRYAFKMIDTQKISVIYAPDSPSKKIYIMVTGKNWELKGGSCVQLFKVPTKYVKPDQNSPGEGIYAIAYYDNNWS